MPRKPRTPGYPNRSDLREQQPVQTPKGQPYGDRKKSEQAQQAVPLPNAAGARQDLLQRALQAAQADPRGAQPGQFTAPTARPDEPLTAGVPMGPGPGQEAMPIGGDPTLMELRAYYRDQPSEDLREVIAIMEAEGRG